MVIWIWYNLSIYICIKLYDITAYDSSAVADTQTLFQELIAPAAGCCWQKAFSCVSLCVCREPCCSRASFLPWAASIHHHLPHSNTRKLKPSQVCPGLKFSWKAYRGFLETAWQLTPHQFCFLPFQSTGIAPEVLLDIPPKCNLTVESAIGRPKRAAPSNSTGKISSYGNRHRFIKV